ncbi:4'-phosphopantetheinyl transferase family protein [Streptomyces sp. PsTaAH-124]|uniref:4'-phosphopantetheinyl transferase family protein n=1 Tax=Streptomyces sp. PsTaAH-124 TaxID=1157638 RepID=UPI00039BA082|nr:4'-phosphopantetheinyl transferase superfamily protein [Streptomyces sp. PsTaAH-124]
MTKAERWTAEPAAEPAVTERTTAEPAVAEPAEQGAGRTTGGAAGQETAPPVHVAGPQGPWDAVRERAEDTGRVVVHTTWGEWLTAALLDPGLRTLLGRDWPRYRQTPAPAGRYAFAVSRLVMKHTAAAVLDVPPDSLDVAYEPGGRPTVRGLDEDLHLSLAHTEELIVVAVSRRGPVGVDAESVTRRASFELLRSHVCTPEEAEALAALPDAERAARFLRLWTLKEAYTKALGQGMRRRFNAVGFCWDADGGARLADESDATRGWSFSTRLIRERYLVSEAHRASGPVESRLRADPGGLASPWLSPARTLSFPGSGRPGGR